MQFFSRPDRYIGPCGDLRCTLVERTVSGAPVFMRGLRALFITDVHALPRTTAGDIDALARRVAEARAGIILMGGDYADEPEPCRRLFAGLKGLSAPLGIYGVVGNNDREAFPEIDVLRRVMSDAGVTLLVNESRTLRVGEGGLVVAGLDEYKFGQPDPRELYPGEAADGRYRILLSHYPRVVSPMPDLMLSGHTHGGQFDLLGVTPYTIGFERVIKRRRAPQYIAGLHACGDGQVYVGKGIGASRIPLRVGVRPEIDVLVFD